MFDVKALLGRQLVEVSLWHEEPSSFQDISIDDSLWNEVKFVAQVSQLHYINFQLWHQEDLARDPHASDHQIALLKREIDVLNQQRNDLIEKLDERILAYLEQQRKPLKIDAGMNSETPGSVIDRLSISALKIYHMQDESLRRDVDEEHLQGCRGKLKVLQEQREDLGCCLKNLIVDLIEGRKYLNLNPAIR